MDYKYRYYTDDNGTRKKSPESKKDHEQRVRELFDKMDKSDRRPIELKVLKNRVGKKGSVFLDFVAPYSVYEETGTDKRYPRDFISVLPGEGNPFVKKSEDEEDPGERSVNIDGEEVTIGEER